jgi:hypothetical protein
MTLMVVEGVGGLPDVLVEYDIIQSAMQAGI